MNYIERAIENSIRHILVSKPSDPASLGLLRENAVIAIIGSSVVVVEGGVVTVTV